MTADSSRNRLILAGIAGNVMEWYDFAIYGYFAPTIGRHFFPSEDNTTSLIAAFGVFAAGFLMRPLGGVVFGYIGDQISRKTALTLSVIAMAIPTFLMGVLPDYAQIGVTASVLLIALRLVQGLSVGGEYTSSVVFLVEGADPARRGLTGSWSAFGAVLGILLGSAIGALLNSIVSSAALDAWAWRVPFLLGLFVGLAGLYVRRHVPEPHPAGRDVARTHAPLVEAVRKEWRTMLQVAGFNVINAVGFYMVFVFVVTYLKEVVHVRAAQALDINTINMGLLLMVIPAAGALSDRIGRKPLLMVSSMGILVLAWPLFRLMHHQEFAMTLLGQAGFAVLIGLYLGAGPAMMVEAFPASVRCSALSVGYNLCLALLGGTTPMVAAFLIARTHDDFSPAFYLMAAASVSLGVVLTMRETAKVPLR